MTGRRSNTLAAMVAVVSLALAAACDPDAAKDKAKAVGEQLADGAKDKAGELADGAKDKAGELADGAVDRGRQLWDGRKGELSDGAKGLLAKGAEVEQGGVAALITKGQQIAPVAFDVAKTVNDSLEGDVDIEPIIQDLDDADAQAQLDQRISDMPRVETINGVQVGFKDVSQWDSGGRESESAYLILWRADERLIGLVYRSRSRVHIDKLVAEAPRLIAAVQGVL